jgi:hypothetical protein
VPWSLPGFYPSVSNLQHEFALVLRILENQVLLPGTRTRIARVYAWVCDHTAAVHVAVKIIVNGSVKPKGWPLLEQFAEVVHKRRICRVASVAGGVLMKDEGRQRLHRARRVPIVGLH